MSYSFSYGHYNAAELERKPGAEGDRKEKAGEIALSGL
jgi:hypothetical protein